jgi:hypothetical protein
MEAAGPTSRDTPRSVTLAAYIAVACTAVACTVAAALKLGARPGTIRQWFHRAIPYRWQIRLMEHFEGPVEISDWAPEATATIGKPSIAETWRKKHPVSS